MRVIWTWAVAQSPVPTNSCTTAIACCMKTDGSDASMDAVRMQMTCTVT